MPEAHHQALKAGLARVKGRHRAQLQTLGAALGGHRFVVDGLVVKEERHVHALARGHETAPVAEVGLDRLDEVVAARFKDAAHLQKVRLVVALLDVVGHRALHQLVALAVNQKAHARKGLHEGAGHDQVAQAQAREKRFAERAHVDDAVVLVHALQARIGEVAAVAQFAVVVVLNDPRAARAGPLQDFPAAGDAHHHAQGTLMRGRQKHAAGVGLGGQSLLKVKALVVDGHEHRTHVLGGGGGAQQRIVRVFDPNLVAGRKEDLQAHENAQLAAGGDDYPVGRGVHAALALCHFADGLAQLGQPLRVAVVQPLRVLLGVFDEQVRKLAPGTGFARGARNGQGRGGLHRQIVQGLDAVDGVAAHALGARGRIRIGPGGGRRELRLHRQPGRDKAAAAAGRFQVPFGREHAEGRINRGTGHTEVLGQQADGNDAVAGLQLSLLDGFADGLRDLPVQRQGTVALELKLHSQMCAVLSKHKRENVSVRAKIK